MTPNSPRRLVREADILLGTWVCSTDPMVVEAVAQSAFDFLIIDAEHGALDRMAIVSNLMATSAAGNRAIVRIGGDDPVHFMHALDNGADGVLVPRVESSADVERAVSLCRYPPQGTRGFGPHRVGRYYRDEARYTAEANDTTVVLVQIETREAVEDLDAILAVEGLDGILVGRNDLAGSLGLPRDHSDPRLMTVTRDILERAKAAGVARAIAADMNPATVAELRDLGANMIAAGGDIEFMVASVDAYLARAGRGSVLPPDAVGTTSAAG